MLVTNIPVEKSQNVVGLNKKLTHAFQLLLYMLFIEEDPIPEKGGDILK